MLISTQKNHISTSFRLTASVVIRYPDGATYTMRTDAVMGFNDPEFLHRIHIPALTMGDSQAFARSTVLEVTACCEGIPFAVLDKVSLVDLVWDLVHQRPMTMLINQPGCSEASNISFSCPSRSTLPIGGKVGKLNLRRSVNRIKSSSLVLMRRASKQNGSIDDNIHEERGAGQRGNVKDIRVSPSNGIVPIVMIKMIKGCRVDRSKKSTDDEDNGSKPDGSFSSFIKQPCMLHPSPISKTCSSSSILSSSTTSSTWVAPSLFSLGSVPIAPSTLSCITLSDDVNDYANNNSSFPSQSPLPVVYASLPAPQLSLPLPLPSGGHGPYVDKQMIFDITFSTKVIPCHQQAWTHMTLSTACEKGGHWALVSIGQVSPPPSRSCNLICSSHALVGECHQRACRLHAVVVSNRRRHQLGFCQFHFKQLAHKHLVQWCIHGGQGLTTLVAVSKFVNYPSLVHITLCIGHTNLPQNPSTNITLPAFWPSSMVHRQPFPRESGADAKRFELRTPWMTMKRRLQMPKNQQQQHRQTAGSCSQSGSSRDEKNRLYLVKFPGEELR